MSTITQNQVDSFNMSSVMTAGETHNETSTANFAIVMTGEPVANLASNFAFTGAGSNTIVTRSNIIENFAMASSLTPGTKASITESFNMTGVATVLPFANVVSNFAFDDVATPQFSFYANIVESFALVNALALSVNHSETSDVNFANALTFGIGVPLVSSFNFMDAATPSAFVIHNEVSDFTFEDTTTGRLDALTSVVSSANFRSVVNPVDPLAPSYWSSSLKMAASLWRQTPFESYLMHEDELIAAGTDGIYQFGADTDGGAAIAASITGDREDFESAKRKCFEAVYVSATTAAPFKVTVETELGSYDYTTRSPVGGAARVHRAPVGRGLVGNYVRVTVANQGGAAFGINGVQIRVGDTTRTR